MQRLRAHPSHTVSPIHLEFIRNVPRLYRLHPFTAPHRFHIAFRNVCRPTLPASKQVPPDSIGLSIASYHTLDSNPSIIHLHPRFCRCQCPPVADP